MLANEAAELEQTNEAAELEQTSSFPSMEAPKLANMWFPGEQIRTETYS